MLAPSLAVASSPPLALNGTDSGRSPVANGEPATGVNAGGAASALAAPASKPTTANPANSANINPTDSNKRRARSKTTIPVTFGLLPSRRASALGQLNPQHSRAKPMPRKHRLSTSAKQPRRMCVIASRAGRFQWVKPDGVG